MKICSKCNEIKELTYFYKKKTAKDGYQPHCKQCDNIRNDKRRKTPEYRANRLAWEEKNKENLIAYQKAYQPKYFQENREDYKRRYQEWRARNTDSARASERSRFQKPSRKLKHRINQAERRCRKLNATIPGYEAQIAEIYANCPEGYHVDHIVPLRGKNVCGLHVPWNLQYLSAKDNLKKNNKF